MTSERKGYNSFYNLGTLTSKNLNRERELCLALYSSKIVKRFITIAFMHFTHCFDGHGYLAIYNVCNKTNFIKM